MNGVNEQMNFWVLLAYSRGMVSLFGTLFGDRHEHTLTSWWRSQHEKELNFPRLLVNSWTSCFWTVNFLFQNSSVTRWDPDWQIRGTHLGMLITNRIIALCMQVCPEPQICGHSWSHEVGMYIADGIYRVGVCSPYSWWVQSCTSQHLWEWELPGTGF